MSMSIDELKIQVNELKQKISEMDHKLNTLIEWIEQDGTKLSRHVEFVDIVCEKVKHPFTLLMDKVNYVLYHKNPFIEYSEIN
jgi:hypothetical protein